MSKLRTIRAILSTAPTWRPRHVADLATSIRRERSPLKEAMPWLSWPCIDWLEGAVRPGMSVFEYGAGGSTLFFLQRGCRVTTVEGSAEWVSAVREHAAALAHRLDLRFVDSQTSDPALRAEYAEQARIGGPWDLILIDGAFRSDCVRVARECVTPTGTIVVDNTDLPEYADVEAPRTLAGFDRRIYRGIGFARVLPTTTEVYRRMAAR